MPTVTIDGKEITVPQGTTVLRAAEQAGVKIPYFCYHPALGIPANCRMCLVEIEGGRKLEPSCYTSVRDGMVVHTESEQVTTAREAVLEFILVNHPVDCPICDQAGECWLQDHYLKHDAQASRLNTEKVAKAKVYDIGPEVVLDAERCILCTRCVRFCDEITGTNELTTVERGDRTEIRIFPGHRLDNPYSICTADLCPVGALTPKRSRFKRRAWLLQTNKSICTGCSRNCSVHLDHFQGKPERYKPRFNPDVNDYWMCDQGRHTIERLLEHRLEDIRIDGRVFGHWSESLRPIVDRLKQDGLKWAFVLSPQASTECLTAAVHFAKGVLGEARLFAGGLPDAEGDDLLLRPSRNPNSAGLEHAADGVPVGTIDDLAKALDDGSVDAVYLMDSTLPFASDMAEEHFLEKLKKVRCLVLQSIWTDVYAGIADILLPAAAHAEQAGTYVNCDGVVQRTEAATRAPGLAMPHSDIFTRIARIAQSALPWSDRSEIADTLEMEVYEPPQEIPNSALGRAPHGPRRVIPGRNATPPATTLRYGRP